MADNSILFLKNLKNKIDNIFNKNNISKDKISKRKIIRVKKTKKIIIDINNNNTKKNIKTIKIRNAGVDLVRILAMIGIVIWHILIHGGALNKYHRYDKLNLFNSFFFWHLNGYGLISGIVGYKTHKYSNLLHLWLCVLFYSIIINCYYRKYKPLTVINDKLSSEFFPVIFFRYWYFTKYFGMYLFLPPINKGIEYLTKSELKILVLSLFGVIIIWQDYKNKKKDAFGINNGYSVLWFIVLYITGGYIGKYNVIYNGIKKFFFCLICLSIFISSSLLCYYLPKYNLYNIKGYYLKKIIIFIKKLYELETDSLPKNIQAISLTLLLMQIKYNKYIAKIISFIGPLTFGVYIIHDNNLVRKNEIRKILNDCPINLPFNSLIKTIITKSLKIFGLCIIMDYIRYILFTICRIRKICILLERIIYKILG